MVDLHSTSCKLSMQLLNKKANQWLRKYQCLEIDHRKNTSFYTGFGLPKVTRNIKSRRSMLRCFYKKHNVEVLLDETKTVVFERIQSENQKVNTSADFSHCQHIEIPIQPILAYFYYFKAQRLGLELSSQTLKEKIRLIVLQENHFPSNREVYITFSASLVRRCSKNMFWPRKLLLLMKTRKLVNGIMMDVIHPVFTTKFEFQDNGKLKLIASLWIFRSSRNPMQDGILVDMQKKALTGIRKLMGTLNEVIQSVVMAKIYFGKSEKLLPTKTFGLIKPRFPWPTKIGNGLAETSFTSSRLLLGTMLDVIQKIFMAKIELCNRGRRKR